MRRPVVLTGRVQVGDRVGLNIDPGRKSRVLHFDRRCGRATLTHMGRNELGVNTGRMMTASPATSATRVWRHTQAVARQRRASHPAVTSLAPSIASAIPTTASGAPGNNTTMPLMEEKAVVPAKAIAAVYAATSMPPLRCDGARGVTGP
jgi:hypothetical protein